MIFRFKSENFKLIVFDTHVIPNEWRLNADNGSAYSDISLFFKFN